jgi:hypothetical protein
MWNNAAALAAGSSSLMYSAYPNRIAEAWILKPWSFQLCDGTKLRATPLMQ